MNFRNLLLISLVSIAPIAHAGDDLTLGANLWANFKYNQPAGGTKTAGFDIDRAYFKANYKFNDSWAAKTTTEVSRHDAVGATANLGIYLKNAYIQNQGLWTNGTMDFGLKQHTYNATVQSFTKSRWLTTNLTDTMKFFKNDDAGVWGGGSCMDKSLDYSIGIHNGAEGTTSAVSDNKMALSFGAQYHINKDFGVLLDDTLSTAGGSNIISAAVLADISLMKLSAEWTMATKPGATGTAPMGFGGTAHFDITDDHGLFAKFFTGNDPGKIYLGTSSLLSVGPTMTVVKDKVNTAFVYDMSKPTTGDSSWDVRWQWAANF